MDCLCLVVGAPFWQATLRFADEMLVASAFYIGWQIFYLLVTECIFPAEALDSSIRQLSKGKAGKPPPRCYSGITYLVYKATSAMGLMRPGELFDSEHLKTKIIFVSVQFLYTAATMLISYVMWGSFRAHLAYMAGILVCNVWNGGSYYIEVFSKAYMKQFQGDAETRRRLQLQLVVEGTLPDAPEAVSETATDARSAGPTRELDDEAAADEKPATPAPQVVRSTRSTRASGGGAKRSSDRGHDQLKLE